MLRYSPKRSWSRSRQRQRWHFFWGLAIGPLRFRVMPMTTAAHLNSMETLGVSVLHERSGETWIGPDSDPPATLFPAPPPPATVCSAKGNASCDPHRRSRTSTHACYRILIYPLGHPSPTPPVGRTVQKTCFDWGCVQS